MMESSTNHQTAQRRRGVTLLELLVVVTLMGTLSTVVVSRYGRDIFGDLGARSEAHRLWLDLQQAQTQAIRNGTSASVAFLKASSGSITGYRLTEQTPAGIVQTVSDVTSFGSDIRVTSSSSTVDFTFEGHARQPCSISLQGPNRSWELTVVPLSGAVNISER